MKHLNLCLLLMLALLILCPPAHAEELPERLILVNKSHALPSDYVPADLVRPNVRFRDAMSDDARLMSEPAARALETMFAAAADDGITLVGMSAFRSYWTQDFIYKTRLEANGLDHVSKYNAMAGQSEHQTGLAMDLSSPDCMKLETWFQETDAYAWLIEHCGEYGFIIRYLKGMEEETGYAFEPWHVRYVGEAAAEIMESGLSLESYLALTRPKPYKRPQADKALFQTTCVR